MFEISRNKNLKKKTEKKFSNELFVAKDDKRDNLAKMLTMT